MPRLANMETASKGSKAIRCSLCSCRQEGLVLNESFFFYSMYNNHESKAMAKEGLFDQIRPGIGVAAELCGDCSKIVNKYSICIIGYSL